MEKGRVGLNFGGLVVDNRDIDTTEIHVEGVTLQVSRKYLELCRTMTGVGHVVEEGHIRLELTQDDIQYLLDNMNDNNPDWVGVIDMVHERLETLEQMNDEYVVFVSDLQNDGLEGAHPVTFTTVMWEWELRKNEFRLTSLKLAMEFLRHHNVPVHEIDGFTRWTREMEKLDQGKVHNENNEKLLKWVLEYVYVLSEDDNEEDGSTLSWIKDGTGLTEEEIRESFMDLAEDCGLVLKKKIDGVWESDKVNIDLNHCVPEGVE